MLKEDNVKSVKVNLERCKYYLSVGALPTDRIARFCDAADFIKPMPWSNPNKGKPRTKRLECEVVAAKKAKGRKQPPRRQRRLRRSAEQSLKPRLASRRHDIAPQSRNDGLRRQST